MKSKIDTRKINYGIPAEDLDRIVSCIKKNTRITDIILFGSRAKGNFQKGSDIDIALAGDKLTLNELLQIKVDVEELMLLYKIDIVDLNKIKNKELHSHIKRVGKYLN